MKARGERGAADESPAPLSLKGMYNIGQLAKVLNISRHKVKKYLETEGVPMSRCGRHYVVLLSDLSERCRQLLETIQETDRIRHGMRLYDEDPVSE
jgi:hypothetical protein